MQKIAIIGSINADYSVYVAHAPRVGETILAKRFSITPGGKGANQAFAVGRLGGDIVMLGAVGADSYGSLLLDSLKSADADVRHVMRSTTSNTGMALITVNADGDNNIIVVPGANSLVDEKYIDSVREVIERCDIVVMQLEIPFKTVLYTAKLAKTLGKTVILDPAPASVAIDPELFRYVDIATPNETELAMLTGDPEASQHLSSAAAALKALGVGSVIATLGDKGAFLSTADGFERLYPPTPGIRAVDTTAAGDSFTASVAISLASGQKLPDAIQSAMAVAEIVITRKGAQASIPSKDELRERVLFPKEPAGNS
jgi:ribokinase